MYTRSLVSLALLAASLTAFAAPFIGSPVSTVVYTGAPWGQEQPQAASDGTNFLVAWRDNRQQAGYETIYAARIGADGRALDGPTAIALPDPQVQPVTSWTNSMPAVVWTGAVYIVAWDHMQSNSIRFVRVDRDGHLLDSVPRAIDHASTLRVGAAASTGSGALLVYGALGVSAALFDIDGNLVKRDIAFPRGVADDSAVVAATNDAYLVAWRRWDGASSTVYVARVARDGTVGAARGVATTFAGPELAVNGNDLALIYIDGAKHLAFEHLDGNGNSISQTVLGSTAYWPFFDNVIARYGSGYVLAVRGAASNSVTGTALNLDGAPLGTVALTTRGVTDGAIAIAANAQATIVAWPEALLGGSVDRDIFARFIGSHDDTLVSTAAARQSSPRVASSGSGHLALWLEYRGDGDGQLRAQRLALDGTPLDGEGITIANHVSQRPFVVFDGHNFVVAWQESGSAYEIRTMRITPDGQLLDGPHGRLALSVSASSFAIGSNGRDVLLVWSGVEDSGLTPFVRAARLASDGSIQTPYVEVPTNARSAVDLAISATADTWLIAWSEVIYRPTIGLAPPLPPVHDISAARLTSSLNVIDATPRSVAGEMIDEQHASIASNGSDFLIAWDTGTNVIGRAMTASGILNNPVTIGHGTYPSAAWRGDEYDVAWESSGSLFDARFEEQPRPTLLAAGTETKSRVVITQAPGRSLVALYERQSSEVVYGNVTRVFVRYVPPPRVRSVRH
jgi:hypothetical protein